VFKYILFADYTNLLCCERDLSELVRMINVGLENFADVVSVNRLYLNVSKTNYMILETIKSYMAIDVNSIVAPF